VPHPEDLEFDAWITVHRKHPISCDTFSDEVQFRIGSVGNSLVLCFTWSALTKFLRVARRAAKLSSKKPAPGVDGYEVFADEQSHLAHRSGRPRLEETQIILGAAGTKK
jgi:hypothetical protein